MEELTTEKTEKTEGSRRRIRGEGEIEQQINRMGQVRG
jgi:hypothetical protein